MKITYDITLKLTAACCLIFLLSAVSPPSASAVSRSIRDDNSCAAIQGYAVGNSFVSVGKSCNLQGQTYASSKHTSGDQSLCNAPAVQKFSCIKRVLSSETVNGKKTFGECIEQAEVCISKS